MNPMKHIVDRFLSWQLPKDFAPDAGISFKPMKLDGYGTPWWPVGTNLFTAEQAEKMFKYVLSDAISVIEITEQELNEFKSQEAIIATERAISDKLLEALRYYTDSVRVVYLDYGTDDIDDGEIARKAIAEVEELRRSERSEVAMRNKE